jgi:hypothetical protein
MDHYSTAILFSICSTHITIWYAPSLTSHQQHLQVSPEKMILHATPRPRSSNPIHGDELGARRGWHGLLGSWIVRASLAQGHPPALVVLMRLEIGSTSANNNFWAFGNLKLIHFSNRSASQETTQIRKLTFYILPSKHGANSKLLL